MSAGLRLLVAALLLGPLPLAAQATLDQVDALIEVGRTEEARIALMSWLEGTPVAEASQRQAGQRRADAQRALWLRALLTVDPAQAAVDYQRLIVEYPGGSYADRALLRLAQAAAAQGDPARARDHLRALLRDYPTSPTRLEAGGLLASVEREADAEAAAPSAASSSTRDAVPAIAISAPAPARRRRRRARLPPQRPGAGPSSWAPSPALNGRVP